MGAGNTLGSTLWGPVTTLAVRRGGGYLLGTGQGGWGCLLGTGQEGGGVSSRTPPPHVLVPRRRPPPHVHPGASLAPGTPETCGSSLVRAWPQTAFTALLPYYCYGGPRTTVGRLSAHCLTPHCPRPHGCRTPRTLYYSSPPGLLYTACGRGRPVRTSVPREVVPREVVPGVVYLRVVYLRVWGRVPQGGYLRV